MNKKLLKMMLVAVGMAAGTMNSWGDVISSLPVTEDFEDGTNCIFEGGKIYNSSTLGNVLCVYKGTATATATFDTDENTEGNQPYTIQSNEKVTIAYTAFQGYESKGKNAVVTVANSEGKGLVSYSYNLNDRNISDVSIGGTTVSDFSAFSCQSKYNDKNSANGFSRNPYQKKDGYNPQVTMTISGNGYVTIRFVVSGYNVDKTFSAMLGDDVVKDIANITISSSNTYEDRAYSIDNFSITSETTKETTAAYTVKRVCGDKVLSTETVNGIVGVTPTFDTSAYYDASDNNKKYIYVSNDAETVGAIAANGTEYTLTYREAETCNYTVNAVDENGNTLQAALKSGSFIEGESARAYYPKAINVDGKWYMNAGNKSYPTYGMDVKESGDINVVYALSSNVAYYAEVEDIHQKSPFVSSGNYPERYSDGKAGRLGKNSYAYTDAFATTKTYTVYLWARNNSGSAAGNITLGLRDAEGNVTNLENAFADWGKGVSALQSVAGVTIPAGYSLVLNNVSEYNSNLEMDYIYLVEEVPASVTATVTSAEYATYVPAYNVVAPADVKTYGVKVNADNSGVELSEIAAGTVIPAGAAILLNAAEGSYNFTVSTAEAATIENNDLKAAAADITATGSEYCLTQQNGKVGFAPVKAGVAIPAGKAYLVVDNASAAKFMALGGVVTAISNVEAASAADGAYYTLQGVQTVKPAKGLYIHNGKKVIVK